MDTASDPALTALRQAGLRSTPQRLAIAREVFSRQHPTVAEIYAVVRRSFPTIGLATIYNTLKAMTERGLVRELPFADAIRFDANLTPHANLVCRRCGAIEDCGDCDDLVMAIRTRVEDRSGFQPETQRVDLYGLCRACAGRADVARSPATSPVRRGP
ncbi:MAG: Fur family transcriptional regulator [Dehalococcoidia bacterium]